MRFSKSFCCKPKFVLVHNFASSRCVVLQKVKVQPAKEYRRQSVTKIQLKIHLSPFVVSLLQNGPEMTGVASTFSIISTRIDLLITTFSSKGHFSKILDVLLTKIANM